VTAVVLLRVVPDAELARGITRTGLRLDDASGDAISVALSYARASGGEVHAIACGPPEWEPALREAMALGVSSLRRAWDGAMADADLLAHAQSLAGLIGDEVRLVIAGPAAGDHGSGLLPFALAECLGWPALEGAIDFSAGGGRLAVRTRASGGRRLTFEVPERAVVVAARGNPLPYPTVARKLAARKAPISVSEPCEDPVPVRRLRLEGFGPARPVTRHLLRPSASANAGGRLRQLMAAGVASGGPAAQTLKAGDGLAGQVADLLAKEGLLS